MHGTEALVLPNKTNNVLFSNVNIKATISSSCEKRNIFTIIFVSEAPTQCVRLYDGTKVFPFSGA